MNTTVTKQEILDAWHASRAISNSRYDRMQYVLKHLYKEGMSRKALWLQIEHETSPIHALQNV